MLQLMVHSRQGSCRLQSHAQSQHLWHWLRCMLERAKLRIGQFSHSSLAEQRPDLAAEWDAARNEEGRQATDMRQRSQSLVEVQPVRAQLAQLAGESS